MTTAIMDGLFNTFATVSGSIYDEKRSVVG